MGNIKTILAGLSLTMAVGMPAAASDELTMVVGTYTDQSTSDGKHVIEVASAALTEEFGKGFSKTNIMNFKKFYLKFKELTIPQTVSEEFKKQKHQTLSDESSLLPQKGQTQSAQSELRFLPWSHYERLIRVEDKQAREWYAKEAFEQGWSFRTLNRNINTLYYERLPY